MTPLLAITLLVFLTLFACALWLGFQPAPARPSARPHRDRFRRESEPARRKRMAVIVNPTKFDDLTDVRSRLAAAAAAVDWDPPLILETTAADPGYGQALVALSEGVDVVAPLGGDGTVRVVASALVGTSTPLGLLPAGTGNLLARNLELPVADLAESVRLACTGRNRAIDVGFVALHTDSDSDAREDGPPGEHPFVVMAGIGLDATIMSDTSEAAKAKLGWTAYVATGLRNFLGPRLKAQIAVDGGPPQPVLASTILIGNVGRITGGINLLPEAEADDGILNCVVLAPKGLPGWVNITARVMTKNRGKRTELIKRYAAREFEVTTEAEQPVQLDGDVIGTTRRLSVRVAPGALLVRT